MSKTFEQLLDEWLVLKAKAKKLQEEEMELRKSLAKAAFQDPKEGTNNLELVDGRKLKMVHKINRTVDQGVLPAVRDEMNAKGLVFDPLIKWKPELVISEFRKLTPEGLIIVSRAITSKDGAPELSVS